MRPKRSAAVLLSAALLALAGCGGGDEEEQPADTGAAPPAETQTETEAAPGTETGTQTAPGEEAAAAGEVLFTENCGSCHTLEAAGTTGTVGPSLDQVRPDVERVLTAIERGPGVMPEGLLDGAEAEAVAEYVAENAGR